MRIAQILGLILGIVAAVMALGQVSDLEDDIVAASTGVVATFADNLTFFWLLGLMVLAVALVAGVLAWVMR